MAASGWGIPGASTYRALVQDIVEKKLAKYEADSFEFEPFIGTGNTKSVIVSRTQLSKEAGDKITIGMEGYLSAAPTLGDTTLEGSEEACLLYDQQVYINQIRNAVINKGQASKQRASWDIVERALSLLGDWHAREKTQQILFAMYYGWSPNVLIAATTYGGLNINTATGKPARYWYMADQTIDPTYSATDATYRASILAAEAGLVDTKEHRMCPALIDGLATKARVANMAEPLVKGMSGYVLLLHPYQCNQLRRNTEWVEAMRHAMPRGKDNPLFTSYGRDLKYFGTWNNVHIYECNFIHSANQTRYNTAGGAVATLEMDGDNDAVRRALFLGANACALAIAAPPSIENKDDFDYNNISGRAIRSIMGAARASYTSDDGSDTIVDQGTIVVSTYSPATSLKGE